MNRDIFLELLSKPVRDRKTCARWLSFCIPAVLFSVAIQLNGQIAVSGKGSEVQEFASAPSVGTWSTLFTFGTSAAYSGSNAAAAMDLGVQRFAASNINEALPATTAATGGAIRARWNSVSRCLQTQVDGGIDAVMLMGTLTNISSAHITGFTIQFGFAIPGAMGPEDIPGHRLYFNVSGTASNWVSVTTVAIAGQQTISIDLSSTPWAPGTAMYLLFMDDNAVTNPEGSYQIDNLVITDVAPGLRISRDAITGEVTLSWRGGATLQEASVLGSSNAFWTNLPEAHSPYPLMPTGAAKFFRLQP